MCVCVIFYVISTLFVIQKHVIAAAAAVYGDEKYLHPTVLRAG
jgi:hypothetical protein